jgi:hypothetical protein
MSGGEGEIVKKMNRTSALHRILSERKQRTWMLVHGHHRTRRLATAMDTVRVVVPVLRWHRK